MIGLYLPYLLLTALFLVGVYCAVTKKNLIKIVVGLAISEVAVNLFLVTLGYNSHAVNVGGRTVSGLAPIETATTSPQEVLAFVDPLPQALVLTSVVIGLSTLALAVAICIRLYDRYRTYDITEIRRLRG
jgi:multicomponent Na+:H+ antiporter subunit C